MGLVIGNSLVTGAIYALTALGLVMVYKTTKVFNFAHGIISGLCGYLAYQSAVVWEWPFPVAVLLAIVVGAAVGYVVERLLLARLYRRSARELVIATFGVSMIIEWVIIEVWWHDERAIPVPWGSAGISVLGMPIPYYGLLVIGIAVAVGLGLTLVLQRSETGLRLRTTFEDPTAAQLCGVDVGRVRSLSWALGGALAGLAGALIAPLLFLSPGSMNSILITAFAAAVIGGFSSLQGAALGGFLVALTLNIAGTYVSLEFRNIILYAVVVLFLWLRPHGLLGERESHEDADGEDTSPGRVGLLWQRLRARASGATAGVRPTLPGGFTPQWLLHAVLVVLAVTAPLLLGPTWRLSLGHWLVTFVAVAGVSLILNYAGQFSLAQSAFMGLAAYVTAVVVGDDGSRWWLGMLAGVGSALVVALVVAVCSARLRGPYFAAMTLALALALPETAFNWSDVTGGANGMIATTPVVSGTAALTSSATYTFVAVFAVVVFVGLVWLRNSRLGHRMVLSADSARAAVGIGIRPAAWTVAVITVGCTLGGLSGSLNAFLSGVVSPEGYGFNLAMSLFVAAVVGGSIAGAFWGSAVVVLVPVAFQTSNELSTAIFGAVILLALFVLPRDLSALDVLSRQSGRSGWPAPPSAPATRERSDLDAQPVRAG